MANKVKVEILGDASSLNRALRSAGTGSNKFHKALVAGAAAAGTALLGLGIAAKIGWGEFSEQAKVGAQTSAVLKSTGGAANVTKKHVNALAESLMRLSGVDDEAIQKGENMLLTFRGIRNEAGKGNNIFDQSTKALMDMSVALGGDPQKNAIRLGKALQDPIKGATALRRVGVMLTDSQTKLIKKLVESGDTMGAQKVILKELNKEFGGSAKAVGETLPGKLNILKETMKNLAGEIVGKAAPALTDFANAALTKGLPAIEKFSKGLITAIGPAVERVAGAFKDAWPGIRTFIESVGAGIAAMSPVFQKLADIGAATMQALGQVMKQHGDEIREIFKNLGEVVRNVATVVLPILAFFFEKVLPIAIRIAIPILETVTGVIAGITGVVANVSESLRAFGRIFSNTLPEAFGSAISWLRNHWPAIATIIAGPFAPIVAAATGAFGIRSALTGAFGAIKSAVAGIVDDIVGFFAGLPGRLASIGARAGAALVGALKSAINSVVGQINHVIGRVNSALSFSVNTHLPGIGTIHIDSPNIPSIPGLASGGIVTSPTLAMIGERGPEAVVPLGRGVGGNVFHVYLSNVYGDADKAALEFRDRLKRLQNTGQIPNVGLA